MLAILLAMAACHRSRPAEGSAPNVGAAAPARATTIINARIIDGTGAPAYTGSVRVVRQRIDRVSRQPDGAAMAGDSIIDAHGLALAPGFIDTHSHADRGIFEHPDAIAATNQGVTTVVVGQDGDSPWPLAAFFDSLHRRPAAINVASYAGHATLREQVLKDDFARAATDEEVRRMSALLTQEMKSGALGLSTGLEYEVGFHSTTGELVSLARVAAGFGGRYISHIRSEDRHFWQAVDEVITIGREAHLPVQISHTKLAMRGLWGQGDSLLRHLDSARASGVDITGDIYSYPYWHSTIKVLFPDGNFSSPDEARMVLREIVPADGVLISYFDPDTSYVGKTLAQVAAQRRTEPALTLLALIHEVDSVRKVTGHGEGDIIATSMDERDIETLMRWPEMNLCSDGELDGTHPRGYGNFTRFLGRYVRDRHVVSLEEGVRKMTNLAAAHVGIRERGRIAPGLFADLVLFDPATVVDRATPQSPHLTSVGIAQVWVNGTSVYNDGRPADARPGMVIRRAG